MEGCCTVNANFPSSSLHGHVQSTADDLRRMHKIAEQRQ
jgi:hypothetical protein